MKLSHFLISATLMSAFSANSQSVYPGQHSGRVVLEVTT